MKSASVARVEAENCGVSARSLQEPSAKALVDATLDNELWLHCTHHTPECEGVVHVHATNIRPKLRRARTVDLDELLEGSEELAVAEDLRSRPTAEIGSELHRAEVLELRSVPFAAPRKSKDLIPTAIGALRAITPIAAAVSRQA